MLHVNLVSSYLHSHEKMKLNSVKTCKNETKLNCEEKCVIVIYNMIFASTARSCLFHWRKFKVYAKKPQWYS